MTKQISEKIIQFEELGEFTKRVSQLGKKIALCHGVFDLLHPGHVRHFAKAREMGEILIVSITADQYVNKGPGRPAFSENLRAESLANIVSVDFVIITPHPTAIEVLEAIRPDYYVKGSDYAKVESDKTGNIVKEKKIVESYGGRLFYTDEIVFSSSQLINRFIPIHSNELNEWVEKLKLKYSKNEILNWLYKISELNVAVIGETIIDIYTECEALGKSAKDPVLCFNKGPSIAYLGGILAIGKNALGLGAKTTIVTGINKFDLDMEEIQTLKKSGIDLQYVDITPYPTIKKQRFVDKRTSTRVLELYEMNDNPLNPEKNEQFINLISKCVVHADVIIIADYGHGLISEQAVNLVSNSNKYLAVNVQSNAGNGGFNSITRYPRLDFVTLNGMEAKLESKRKQLEVNAFIENLKKISKAKQILVTRGGDGIDIYSQNLGLLHAPAFTPFVKDRVGAGDVVLTITSLLAALKAPPDIIGFYGNISGAWAVSFIGNEKNLEIGTLDRYARSILS
jgi:rfaE bifunctional protein nucleotidyltransferase chain/domain